jgi:cell division protease FtsH
LTIERKQQTDLLARAYLDILAAEEGTSAKAMLRRDDPDDPIEMLLDDLSSVSEDKVAIRADYAAGAVLVARAIEAVEGLTRDLRRGSPVVTVTVHASELVGLAEEVIRACAFGSNAKVMDMSHFTTNHSRPVLLIARDGSASGDRSDKGNDIIARAIHTRAPIVGIATDPRRHLPRDLLRACEYKIEMQNLDASAIGLVVEAVTGKVPAKAIDESLVRACDVSDLTLAIRRDLSPDACIERLQRIVAEKRVFVHDGPMLEELSGYGEAKKWGLELAADIAEYRAGRLAWEDLDKSVLLAGPPGVGKTSLARAIAKTANLPLVATSVADWNSAQFLSGTLAAIKDSFFQARRLAPCILLIDEIDGISDRAKVSREHKEYWVQIVNSVLENLSGIEHRAGVVVIAATNFPDEIDPAIRRAGRLDRTITIEKPSLEDLRAILRFHLKDVLKGTDLTAVAVAAVGGTGADIESWTRRARSRARRERREILIDDLLEEIRSGRSVLAPTLRRAVAIHEAGHLIVGIALKVFEPHSLSIADDGGRTRAELVIENSQTLRGIENIIVMLLSGRAAEEEFMSLDGATAGAGAGGDGSDLAKATRAAADIELRFGLGALGTIHFNDHVAEMMMHDSTVLGAIRTRLADCHARALKLVASNRETVEVIARHLSETGYLSRAEIESLVGTRRLSTGISLTNAAK